MAWTEPWPRSDSKPEPSLTPYNIRTPQLHSAFLLPLLLLITASMAGPPQPATPPLLSGQPFIIFWGIPNSSCSNRADPRLFGIEREGRVAVFYEDTLGNYPYFVDKDTPVNGGLPQHTKLNNHLQKTQQDLEATLPAPRYLGLGVLRWAEWVPQWSRNREKQTIYLEASRNMMKSFFPKWTPEEVERWSQGKMFGEDLDGDLMILSQVDFEAAAKSVMMETLRELQRLRPKALWGVTPYPICYNGNTAQTMFANYTGQCPAPEMSLNDELLWLWKRCSALYPLLTLEKLQSGTSGARLYLSSQIKEALRVSSLTGKFDLPVFPLVKSVYTSTNTFLSQTDLVSTIGESAAMGTAGVVIWERNETKTEATDHVRCIYINAPPSVYIKLSPSQRECQDLAEFVRKVLGPYAINVTTATRLCSASLCQGKGRCVRQNPESSAYLHLSPPSKVTEKAEAAKATNQPDTDTIMVEPDPAEVWKNDFQCQWYKTVDGDVSDQQSPKDGTSVDGAVEKNSAETAATTTALTTTAPPTAPPTAPTTASTTASTTKGASVTELRGSSSPSVGRSTPSLEVPTDGGINLLGAPNLTVLLFLVAGNLCLEP